MSQTPKGRTQSYQLSAFFSSNDARVFRVASLSLDHWKFFLPKKATQFCDFTAMTCLHCDIDDRTLSSCWDLDPQQPHWFSRSSHLSRKVQSVDELCRELPLNMERSQFYPVLVFQTSFLLRTPSPPHYCSSFCALISKRNSELDFFVDSGKTATFKNFLFFLRPQYNRKLCINLKAFSFNGFRQREQSVFFDGGVTYLIAPNSAQHI